MARRIAVVGVSGNGKTTFARRLAAKLEVPYTELDALNHLPGWIEASDEDLRRDVVAVMDRSDGWVLDGSYQQKLGDLVLRRADTLVWLDQPLPLVLRRLITRAVKDIVTKRDLFNGNRQTWRFAFWGRESLVGFAIRQHFRRRRDWPESFAAHPGLDVVRLRVAARGRALARVPGAGLVRNTQDDLAELLAGLEPFVCGGGVRQGKDPVDDR